MDFDSIMGEAQDLCTLPAASAAYVKMWNSLEDRLRALSESVKAEFVERATLESVHDMRANVILSMLE